MTVKIEALQRHLQDHPKDHSSRRGLEIMKHKRRRLLVYMKRTGSRRRAREPARTRERAPLIGDRRLFTSPLPSPADFESYRLTAKALQLEV